MRLFDPVAFTREVLGTTYGEVSNLTDRLLDRHLRIAVTGLRRSGKTVFTTSLVHHLLSGRDLPFVKAIHENRYHGARLLPVEGEPFPYLQFHRELQSRPPSWPMATQRLTSLRLEIRFRTSGTIGGYLQPQQKLLLDIIDYPGEWLLDLPLLETGFEAFSQDALARARLPGRTAAADPWLKLLAGMELEAYASREQLEALIDQYRHYLARCQRSLGFSLIQPGRMLGPEAPADALFCPLPPGPAPRGSVRAVMAERYDRYREQLVRPFFEEHFQRFDRQVVLVDLFASLNAGPAHFEDTSSALKLILKSFRYGENSILRRLFAPRIDRVLFAASKADHVAANQHPNLKQLLELITLPAREEQRMSGVRSEVIALASLRCTDTVKTEHQGQILSCVRGRLKSEDRETVLFPGEIPPDLPTERDWDRDHFRFYDFAPRPLEEDRAHQHIRLDQAIEFLLGDKLA